MSWNLVWWLTTSDYFQKCKNMEYQNSGPSGTLKPKEKRKTSTREAIELKATMFVYIKI